jgi:hypothetical protein
MSYLPILIYTIPRYFSLLKIIISTIDYYIYFRNIIKNNLFFAPLALDIFDFLFMENGDPGVNPSGNAGVNPGPTGNPGPAGNPGPGVNPGPGIPDPAPNLATITAKVQ